MDDVMFAACTQVWGRAASSPSGGAGSSLGQLVSDSEPDVVVGGGGGFALPAARWGFPLGRCPCSAVVPRGSCCCCCSEAGLLVVAVEGELVDGGISLPRKGLVSTKRWGLNPPW